MKLPIVVSAEQINEVAADGLKFIDLRAEDNFLQRHLPGAVHLDAGLLNRSDDPVGGLLPAFAPFNAAINALGVRAEDHVVAYDHGAEIPAARLVWVMHAYGFKSISWLNGGFNAWLDAGFETSTEVVAPAMSDAQLQFTPGNVLSVEQLMDELYNDDVRVLDVRSAAEYNGTDVRAERGGHVPNALHSEWTDVFSDNGLLKSDDELLELFGTLGLEHDHHVVVYCQTHQRSSVTYVVLKHLLYQHVSALDGAWSAWGNRTDTPIEI